MRRGSRAPPAITSPRPPAPGAGATAHAQPRTTIAPRPSTATPWNAWQPTAGAATRSATGRGPATRAGTTSCTGSAGRTRRSVLGRTPSMAPRAAGTQRGSTSYVAALRGPTSPKPAAGRHGGDLDPATAAAEEVDPRAADGSGRPDRGGHATAIRRRGALGDGCRVARAARRQVRPHDRWPPALERGVCPPRVARLDAANPKQPS